MISVEGTVLIHRPSLDVWSFMAEVSNAPQVRYRDRRGGANVERTRRRWHDRPGRE